MSESNRNENGKAQDIAEILRLLRESVESERENKYNEEVAEETVEEPVLDEYKEIADEEDPWYAEEETEETVEEEPVLDEYEEIADEEDPWYAEEETEETVEEEPVLDEYEEIADEEDPWYAEEETEETVEEEPVLDEYEEIADEEDPWYTEEEIDETAEEEVAFDDLEEDVDASEDFDVLSDENLDGELAEIRENGEFDESSVLDETDIGLLYNMGYKSVEGIDETIAPSESTKQATALKGDVAYNYNYEEYVLKSQREEVKLGFVEQKKNILIRLAIAGGAALLLLIYESIAFSGVALPWLFNQFKYPLAHSMISLQLLIIAVAMSLRAFSKGVSDAVCFRSTPYSVGSVLILLNAIYTIVVAIVQPEDYALFNFSGAFVAVTSIVYEYILLHYEERTFDTVSSENARFYALVEDYEGDKPFGDEPTLRAYATDFNKDFFLQMGRKTSAYKYINLMIPVIMGLSVIVFGIFAIVTGNVSASANTAMLILNFAFPIGVMGAYSIPMYQISKTLGNSGAVIGHSSVDRYENTRFVTFDEADLFPSIKTTNIDLKPSGNQNILEVLGKTSKLFSAIGGPLSKMVETPDDDFEPEDVEITGIFDDGISAVVGSSTMLVGGRRFLEINNIDTSVPSDYRDTDDNNEILYVSIDGKLAARYYIKYVPDADFVSAVNNLGAIGISVGIRTRNPGVNSNIIEKRCPEMKYKVYTIKSISNSERDLTSHQSTTDSGIIATGKAQALAKPLVISVLLRKYYKLDEYIRYASATIGALIVIIFAAMGRIGELGSVSAITYQMLWVIPSVVTAWILSSKKKNIIIKLKELFKK